MLQHSKFCIVGWKKCLFGYPLSSFDKQDEMTFYPLSGYNICRYKIHCYNICCYKICYNSHYFSSFNSSNCYNINFYNSFNIFNSNGCYTISFYNIFSIFSIDMLLWHLLLQHPLLHHIFFNSLLTMFVILNLFSWSLKCCSVWWHKHLFGFPLSSSDKQDEMACCYNNCFSIRCYLCLCFSICFLDPPSDDVMFGGRNTSLAAHFEDLTRKMNYWDEIFLWIYEWMNEWIFSICFFMYLNVLLSTISFIVDSLATRELRVMWGQGGKGPWEDPPSHGWPCSIENKLVFG